MLRIILTSPHVVGLPVNSNTRFDVVADVVSLKVFSFIATGFEGIVDLDSELELEVGM